jgi:cell division protein ZapA
MSEQPTRVSVRILEKEYSIACPHEERTDLLDSAEYLNNKMREIRDGGKVVGLDRIAVIAALNMANELLKSRERDRKAPKQLGAPVADEVGNRLRNMRERVEAALTRGQQLEF